MSKPESAAVVDALACELSDQGRLIEMGWVLFRHLVISPDAPDYQLRQLRLAFMAGAQHLWGSVWSTLEDGEELTDNELQRMNNINDEMKAIREELIAQSKVEH
jgi:hypothetical protein